ncbi:MAG: PDZ domain-containing protein [Phycisphaerae bacterium]|nr:PDZ domain-containing protein [Phycisphaerae bacterium]
MDVIVYTSPTCPYCTMVKDFLSQRGISFEERDVSRDSSYAQELVRSTGQMGVPVTIINGQVVVGFDRGRLEQLTTQTQTRGRPPFGASIADASKITAKQGSGIIPGAYVGSVRPGSVAQRIGLAPGDIITELNMKHIANAGDLEDALSNLSSGSRFSLVFLRDNETMTTEGVF